jgi:hypothetical protein
VSALVVKILCVGLTRCTCANWIEMGVFARSILRGPGGDTCLQQCLGVGKLKSAPICKASVLFAAFWHW